MSDCGIGFFKNETSVKPICTECSPGCRECIHSAEYCLSCATNYTLQYDNKCSSECLVTSLFPECQSCLYPCFSCFNDTFYCSSCEKDYFLVEESSQCVSQCSYGFYKSHEQGFGVCLACTLPCVHCQSPSVCLECGMLGEDMYYLEVNNQQGTQECVQQCS